MTVQKRAWQWLLLISICSFHAAFAQNATAISVEKQNVIYCGLDNPIAIAMEKVPCADLKVSVSEGATITKVSDCNYTVRTTQQGETVITVEGGGTIFKKKLRAKGIPDPIAVASNGKHGGILSVSEAQTINGVIAMLNFSDMDGSCAIQSFDVVIKQMRKDVVMFTNQGAGFSGAIASLFRGLQAGDTVIFSNIRCRCPGDVAARTLTGMTFYVK